MNTNPNETSETSFNSTLLGDGTIFSSHTVNTLKLIYLENNDNINIKNFNHNNTINDTNNNINIYENHRHPVKSTEFTHNSDSLNTTNLPLLKINTPLPRSHKQNLVHFNTESIILNTSTQPTSTANQNIQFTPQQLVNFIGQLNSQNNQQATNASTPYYLQAASTQTPSPVVRRNTQIIYPYL